ncbi:MAG: response regulator [Desulfobacula sp.]|nr:response regulator [Desulfobacula sp.]
MKILVIDDEKPTLSMFNLFLTAYGYDVSVARDGEKGLDMFKEISPDIVFTDIKMPGIDGLEVLRRIRNQDTDTQVIIITGHGDMEKAVEALDLDASDFINKPVERKALNSALARAEKRRQLPRNMPFEFRSLQKNDFLQITLTGKLSGQKTPDLLKKIQENVQETINEVHMITDDGFSITRSGISALMTLIQKLRQTHIKISIENLSYNYIRVFQMAGMDKIATLVEEVLPD